MIYERSIFLFAWFIPAILISSEARPANASNQISNYSLSNQIPLVGNTDAKQVDQGIAQISQDKNVVAQQSESSGAPEPDEMMNKRWTGIGIGITSVFFCLLLWILFQPNSQIKTNSDLAKQNEDKLDNEIDTANDFQLKIEEKASLPPLFSLEEESLIEEYTDEPTVVQPAHLIREKQHNSNLTFSEDTPNLTIEPEPVQIDSENQESVRIKATNTTSIDVVFELIQDLQKSDRQVRRKAIWELARTGDSRSIEPLINTIPVVNPADKSLILNAISQIAHRGFEPIYDVLFDSLKDTNSEVRNDAIRDITALHESTIKITRQLPKMLNDSDQEVRQTAIWALKRINSGYMPQLGKYAANQAIPTSEKSKQN